MCMYVCMYVCMYIYIYMSHQADAEASGHCFLGAPKLLQIEAHVAPTPIQPTLLRNYPGDRVGP